MKRYLFYILSTKTICSNVKNIVGLEALLSDVI